MKKLFKTAVAVTLVTVLAAGCGGGGGGEAQKPAGDVNKDEWKNQKIELTWYNPYDEEGFKRDYADPVAKKFPNITLKSVPQLTPEMIATGNIPDVLTLGNQFDISNKIVPDNYAFDLSDLIKKHNFDLNRLEPNTVKHIRSLSGGKLYALPTKRTMYALYYNKDVFDKLNEKYPDPNKAMTWEEVIALTKKLTRNVGGVQYRGMEFTDPALIMGETGSLFLDPKTDEPRYLTDPKYKKFFEMYKELLDIPGILSGLDVSKNINQQKSPLFTKEKNVAMFFVADGHKQLILDKTLNWDIAPMPVWSDSPYGPISRSRSLAISPTSKNKDAAFAVIADVVLSDEYQLEFTKKLYGPTILVKKEILDALGADIPEFQGKNVKGYYVTPPHPGPTGEISKYEGRFTLFKDVVNFATKPTDINTFLRELDAAAKKQVADEKAKEKK